jgi:hypothetical protein
VVLGVFHTSLVFVISLLWLECVPPELGKVLKALDLLPSTIN